MVNVDLFVSFVIVEKHNIVKSYERPIEFNARSRIGNGETDTVTVSPDKACLVTLTNQYSCFLKIQKVAVKKSQLIIEAMVKMLEPLVKETVTPDRGRSSQNIEN